MQLISLVQEAIMLISLKLNIHSKLKGRFIVAGAETQDRPILAAQRNICLQKSSNPQNPLFIIYTK